MPRPFPHLLVHTPPIGVTDPTATQPRRTDTSVRPRQGAQPSRRAASFDTLGYPWTPMASACMASSPARRPLLALLERRLRAARPRDGLRLGLTEHRKMPLNGYRCRSRRRVQLRADKDTAQAGVDELIVPARGHSPNSPSGCEFPLVDPRPCPERRYGETDRTVVDSSSAALGALQHFGGRYRSSTKTYHAAEAALENWSIDQPGLGLENWSIE